MMFSACFLVLEEYIFFIIYTLYFEWIVQQQQAHCVYCPLELAYLRLSSCAFVIVICGPRVESLVVRQSSCPWNIVQKWTDEGTVRHICLNTKITKCSHSWVCAAGSHLGGGLQENGSRWKVKTGWLWKLVSREGPWGRVYEGWKTTFHVGLRSFPVLSHGHDSPCGTIGVYIESCWAVSFYTEKAWIWDQQLRHACCCRH